MSNNKKKRNNKTALEKLVALEQTKLSLIETRNKELLEIISRYGTLTIDDHILIGFLLFISNKDNKDHSIITEFKELAKSKKSPKQSRNQD